MIMKDWQYKVERRYRKRTTHQNSYLHALLTRIWRDIGEELDYVKRHFKNQFLKWVSKNKWIEYIRDTSSLKTVELNEFIEKILNQMAEFGYIYPTPEEYKNWESL